MDHTRAAEREQFDQVSEMLMASLRKSRALNIEIRQALQKTDQTERLAGAEDNNTVVIDILQDVLHGH